MEIILTDSFNKSYKKRMGQNKKLKNRLEERLKLFIEDKPDLIKDHGLKGDKLGLRAFSVTGDIRVVYELREDGKALLVDIGSHNQVYGK